MATLTSAQAHSKTPFYRILWVQVLVAIALAIVLGHVAPARAIAMKPLGDAFIRVITMIITLMIFCTVVSGIAGMENLKKVGRVGGKALLYFEVVSTLALLIGLVVGNAVHPGSGLNINAATLDAKTVADLRGAGESAERNRIPACTSSPPPWWTPSPRETSCEVLFVAILFGFALSVRGSALQAADGCHRGADHSCLRRGKHPDALCTHRSLRRHGVHRRQVRHRLARPAGQTHRRRSRPPRCYSSSSFSEASPGRPASASLRFLAYIKEEILLVLAVSSSETRTADFDGKAGEARLLASPGRPGGAHRIHLQHGRHQPLHDSGCFVRGAGHEHSSTLLQQLTIFTVAILTSKGASGVQGAAFIALVGTLDVVPSIPVAGMAIILGIDRFLSMVRAVVNMVGNGVATLVVARWEKELDSATLRQRLARPA